MDELLVQLKSYLGISDASDNVLLSFLLTLSGQKILDKLYPFDSSITIVPTRYKLKQVEIAQFLFNKRGAEGETSHNENGVSRSYENGDIPDSLMRVIVPFVGSPIKTVIV